MTHKPDLRVLKVYPHTKNKVFRSRLSKVREQTGQTHRHTQTDETERITVRGWYKPADNTLTTDVKYYITIH